MKKNQRHKRLIVSRTPLRLMVGSVALVVAVGVLHHAFPVSSAPVTSSATSKLTVYQGVVTIAPGAAGDNILEVGNSGRDIAGSGDLYLRPGAISGGTSNYARFYASGGKAYFDAPYVRLLATGGADEGGELQLVGAGSYPTWFTDIYQNNYRIFHGGTVSLYANAVDNKLYVPTALCFGAPGSTNCASTWAGASTPTLDTVLGAGNTGIGKTIFLNSQTSTARSLEVTSGLTTGTGSFAFLVPLLGNGSYSDLSQNNDSGLFFNAATGFTLGGWNAGGTIKGIRLAGGTVAQAALAVNNGLAGSGSSGDALAVYANSANSAIFGQQTGGGYAGYFSGKVQVTGNLYVGVFGDPVSTTNKVDIESRTSASALFVSQTGTGSAIHTLGDLVIGNNGVGGEDGLILAGRKKMDGDVRICQLYSDNCYDGVYTRTNWTGSRSNSTYTYENETNHTDVNVNMYWPYTKATGACTAQEYGAARVHTELVAGVPIYSYFSGANCTGTEYAEDIWGTRHEVYGPEDLSVCIEQFLTGGTKLSRKSIYGCENGSFTPGNPRRVLNTNGQTTVYAQDLELR